MERHVEEPTRRPPRRPPGSFSRSRLWLIQVQPDLRETQSVVVVLPEVVLQDAVEQGHASARYDAAKVEADTLERRERARHVLKRLLALAARKDIECILGRADQRTQIVERARRDRRRPTWLAERTAPHLVRGRRLRSVTGKVGGNGGVAGKLEDRAVPPPDQFARAVIGGVEAVAVAHLELARREPDVGLDRIRIRCLLRPERHKDRVTIRGRHRGVLRIVHADDVEVVVRAARRAVAPSCPARRRGAHYRQDRQSNEYLLHLESPFLRWGRADVAVATPTVGSPRTVSEDRQQGWPRRRGSGP